ncbi:hypothetical protein KIW84_024820 [Lathyrus oleraceus]|uniref:Integrase zinc-binding domain-containing protein n=1 Tax=Pisum sativum TaxID=3888 RepID=A0A9D4YHR6_PEA|nr:hypothetical protein KIW84_024820 [Pisum sativum]
MVIRDCETPGPDEGPGPGSRWKLIFDGSLNEKGHGIGDIITSLMGYHTPFTTRLWFTCTNNMAEYKACIIGLGEAIDLSIKILEKQEYPANASSQDRKMLRRLESKFFLNYDVLYKQNHDMVLLRRLDGYETNMLIKEIHEGSFVTHTNGHTMAKKILRAGYYWLTMESDCFKYVKKCHKFRIYVDKVHVPPTPLNVLTAPYPFSMWGIDITEMIKPKYANKH